MDLIEDMEFTIESSLEEGLEFRLANLTREESQELAEKYHRRCEVRQIADYAVLRDESGAPKSVEDNYLIVLTPYGMEDQDA